MPREFEHKIWGLNLSREFIPSLTYESTTVEAQIASNFDKVFRKLQSLSSNTASSIDLLLGDIEKLIGQIEFRNKRQKESNNLIKLDFFTQNFEMC